MPHMDLDLWPFQWSSSQRPLQSWCPHISSAGFCFSWRLMMSFCSSGIFQNPPKITIQKPGLNVMTWRIWNHSMWAALISPRPAEDPIPVERLKPHILLDKTRNAVNYSSCTANIADLLGQQIVLSLWKLHSSCRFGCNPSASSPFQIPSL